ncbi:MAG: tRNA (5-methylaminomethyl-2-thiouridine)(34)-methyltransferase MnmD, partial [Caulobacterales bacterium]|nr:tRNA (5-methylaminomethyl-2-thiouridine)(34)-methyltransferase MnmD [Caulobacterales bacterium]
MNAPTPAPAAPASATLAPGRPDLVFDERGVPVARLFDDRYFSAADGLAEARAVFLAGCDLPAAWAGRDQFTVGELGFGSGLNLIALWELWSRMRPPGAVLHMVSVEGFPLTADQARAARHSTPSLADAGGDARLRALSDALHAAWPPRIKGVHRRWFPGAGLSLTLAHLPVLDALDALEFVADAWFLDGFAPARNPDMWTGDVLAALAARTAPGARAATYTVAGAVRRGLEAAGFTVEKKPGFAGKRERLEAVYRGPACSPARDPLFPRAAAPRPRRVLIIGAGLAGAMTAAALARRGVATHVLAAEDTPAAGASG